MIYENVKRLCTKHKTNIATVEKACGIANGTIGKWAGKDAAPRIDTVKAIADYFGVCQRCNAGHLQFESEFRGVHH